MKMAVVRMCDFQILFFVLTLLKRKLTMITGGLYYKHITIVIDAASVVSK